RPRRENSSENRDNRYNSDRRSDYNRDSSPREKREISLVKKGNNGLVRLNKYISTAGICSRREADVLIESGAVSVNGQVVTEMGFKVGPNDVVNYGGETLVSEKKQYILLNKPKGYISTVDDPQERKTVMFLIHGACKERVYPVGRLDRNTMGLLLFTNDGEMTKRLTHPSHGARKLYQVELDKNVTKRDLEQLIEGFELEDGFISADKAEYVDGADKKSVGVELHSGKNRIVRRMFEHLGYKVVKLDRVMFAGLTKKTLQRGYWRHLTEKEIQFLRMV
ncbi:rRNA pseudouridine synthase, partial [Bacteroidales bacterium OttesenSCG-928-C19]|nr:rRNA pseudouridine synthase [Bacteroidales bacterium OttesenSCG-928-C19]